MRSTKGFSCSLVAALVHDAMMEVKAASSQHCTPAGHHPVCILFSKDEGAGVI